MKSKSVIHLLAGSVITWGLLLQPALALEVDREVLPRLTLGGRLIATPSFESNGGFGAAADKDSNQVDISDSGILLRFDKRIFSNKGVGGAVIGLTKPDQNSDLPDDIFFHQMHGFFWNKDFEVILGRTRLRNTIIEFPTLRDDDMLAYTHVANGSSYAKNDQYQLFGTYMGADWFFRKNHALGLWLSGRIETDIAGTRKSEFNLNTVGFGWSYEISEDMRYVKRLRHAGVLIDSQDVDGVVGDNTMRSIIAGAEWNLTLHPPKSLSLAVQAIFIDGIDGAGIGTQIGRAREKSRSLVTALRYTGRPRLLTRWQAALTVGWKDYSDQNNASQITVTPSYVYKLGQGIDLVAQYSYTKYDDGLAAAIGFDRQQAIQVGLVFNFDQRFNDTIGERQSILNLEHGYIQ